MITDPTGDLQLGSGGVNLYAGGFLVDYEAQQIVHASATIGSEGVSGLSLRGRILSAAINLNAFHWLTIRNSLSTHSAALVSTEYQGRVVMPLEGIRVQTFGNDSVLTVTGDLESDNQISLQSNGQLVVNNQLLAPKVLAIARGQITNAYTAFYNAKDSIKIAADVVDNRANLISGNISITAQKHILNQFGGEIKADVIRLKALGGVVRNGSLKPYELLDADALVTETSP